MAGNVVSNIGAGAGAGFDVNGVVTQLMAIERQPIAVMKSRQASVSKELAAFQSVRSKLDALKSAGNAVSDSSSLDIYAATSSNSSVAEASASSGAATGSLSFAVTRLAGTHTLRSRLVATSLSAASGATTNSNLVVLGGIGSSGVKSVRAGSGLSTGAFAFSVEQSSAAASVTGSSIATLTTIDNSTNQVTFDLNGSSHTISIANGTYGKEELVTAINVAIAASSAAGNISASLSAANYVQLQTRREGSSATVTLTGGSALASVGMSVDSSAHTGTDGILSVRGNSTVVTSVESGSELTLNAGSGSTVIATLNGGLRAVSATGAVVSTGSGSVSDVVAAINNANVGVKATSVQSGVGQWRLQIASSTTGSAGAVAVDQSVFDGMGGMVVSQVAQDASLTFGEGAGAYSVESSTGVFDGVVSGWKITPRTVSAAQVTVSVARDEAGVVAKVQALVTAANDALTELKKQSALGTPGSNNSGPLSGDSTVRSLIRNIVSSFSGSGIDGLSISRTNTVALDSKKFLAAYQKDPSGTVLKLARKAVITGSNMQYVAATAATSAGTYAVSLSRAATKAESTTEYPGGASGAETILVTRGSVSATYTTTAGESAQSIAGGLQRAIDKAGMSITASESSGVKLSAGAYGSASGFSVRWTTTGSVNAYAGLDAAGTIDGEAATGIGQYLSLGTTATSRARGIRLMVTGSTTGAVGTVEYATGIAGAIAGALTSALDTLGGSVALAENARKSRVKGFNTQIASMERRANAREDSLRRQYASLDSTIGKMKAQQASLSSAMGSM